MRNLFLSICAPAIWVIIAAEIVICALLFKMYKKTGKKMVLCMALITLGLIVDAVVIALGSVLPAAVLPGLSRVRFVAHGILIPLLFPICGYALNAKPGVQKAIWIITILVSIAGACEGFATDLQKAEIAGVVRMLSGDGTPGWATAITNVLSFGTVIPLIICGVISWIKQKNPCLFLAGFFMFAFSALGPATGNSDLIFFISMIGEVLMVLFFLLYAKKKLANKK